MTNSLLPVMGLWIGDQLTDTGRLSMASFIACGHPYHLYAYREFQNIPPGVELRDANDILPESEVYKVPDFRGYAAFANWFRWELLARYAGWWADIDMICLKPLDLPGRLVVGMEGSCKEYGLKSDSEHTPDELEAMYAKAGLATTYSRIYNGPLINNALVKCDPPGHPIVMALRKQCLAPRYFVRDRLRHHAKTMKSLKHFGTSFLWPTKKMRIHYGSLLGGPWALTDMIIIHKALASVLPCHAFYPVGYGQCNTLFDKTYAGNSDPFPNTYTVHLWNAAQKLMRNKSKFNPGPDSFVGQMMRRYM